MILPKQQFMQWQQKNKYNKPFSRNNEYPLLYHPDDVSSVILEAYRKHLKRKRK